MRVIRAGIDLQLREEPCAEAVLRQHPFNRMLDHNFGLLSNQLFVLGVSCTGRISRMMEVHFRLGLLSGYLHFARIHDYYKIACIGMRSELSAVLTPQNGGYFGSKPSKSLAVGVDDVPLLLYVFPFETLS